MTTKELRDKVAELSAARGKAREKAAADPRKAEAEAMRDESVAIKLRKDTNQKTVADMVERRDALVAEIMAPVNAIGVELTKARRALKAAEAADRAAALANVSTEDLAGKLHQITAQRRELNAEKRAIRVALDSRGALDAAKAFLPKLTAEQRQALKAELDRK